jgi:hypothetical protein
MNKGASFLGIKTDPDDPQGRISEHRFPERGLWAAVALNSILEAAGHYLPGAGSPTNRLVRTAQARAYLRTDDFRTVCEYAGFDAEVLRPRVFQIIAEADAALKRTQANASHLESSGPMPATTPADLHAHP